MLQHERDFPNSGDRFDNTAIDSGKPSQHWHQILIAQPRWGCDQRKALFEGCRKILHLAAVIGDKACATTSQALNMVLLSELAIMFGKA